MSDPPRNASPEIEQALAEGREIGLREAAAYVAGLKETRVPWIVRGLNSAFHGAEDKDGWAEISSSFRNHLAGVSRGILRLVNNEPVPECVHAWSEQPDGLLCVVCGERKSAAA